MDFSIVYHKNENFVEKDIGEEKVLVPLSDNVADMNHVFTMNSVGSFIYDQIDGENSLEVIFNRLLKEFDVEKEVANSDFEQFIYSTVEKGIIEKRG